jgi:antitoxin component YwqK of YwqJK toxin-antitoxin module
VSGNLVKEVKYKYRKKDYSVTTINNPLSKPVLKNLNIYRNSGKLLHEVNFMGTKPIGVARSYYENGQVCCLQFFKAGKRDSIATVFHDNGQIFETALYKNGRLMQILEKYDRMGHRLEKGNLVDGFGMVNQYDETGRLIAIEHYQKGKRRSRQKR